MDITGRSNLGRSTSLVDYRRDAGDRQVHTVPIIRVLVVHEVKRRYYYERDRVCQVKCGPVSEGKHTFPSSKFGIFGTRGEVRQPSGHIGRTACVDFSIKLKTMEHVDQRAGKSSASCNAWLPRFGARSRIPIADETFVNGARAINQARQTRYGIGEAVYETGRVVYSRVEKLGDEFRRRSLDNSMYQ